MTVHLILDPDGKVFGVYQDRYLMKQKQGLNAEEILNALAVHTSLIVFSEEDMKTMAKLPETVDEIPIDGLLSEAATMDTIENAALNKRGEMVETITPEQIDQMPAGPEINALIESVIFNAIPLTDEEWDMCRAAMRFESGRTFNGMIRPLKIPLSQPDYETKLMFRLEWPSSYSDDFYHSWQRVLGKMRADGWLFELCDYVAIARVDGVAKNDKIVKIASFTKDTIRGEAPAEIDALAICRAALKAKLLEEALNKRGEK